MQYEVKETDTISTPSVMSIPRDWFKENPDRQYARLKVGKYCFSLRVIKREGAGGFQAWVKKGLLKSIDDDSKKKVCIVGISETQFKVDRLFKTHSGRVDVSGMLLILSGLIIHVSFLFGEGVYPFLTLSDETKGVLLGLGSFMSPLGVFVLAVRRLWFSSD